VDKRAIELSAEFLYAPNRLHSATPPRKNGLAREKNPNLQEETVSGRPAPPPGLKKVEEKLWADVLDNAPEHAILDARTLSVLATACAQADLNSELEATLKEDGFTVRGAAGQWHLNAAATELRQGRLALARLLEQVCLDRVQRPPEPEFNDDPLPSWLLDD
jgi:hypothetical protein